MSLLTYGFLVCCLNNGQEKETRRSGNMFLYLHLSAAEAAFSYSGIDRVEQLPTTPILEPLHSYLTAYRQMAPENAKQIGLLEKADIVSVLLQTCTHRRPSYFYPASYLGRCSCQCHLCRRYRALPWRGWSANILSTCRTHGAEDYAGAIVHCSEPVSCF